MIPPVSLRDEIKTDGYGMAIIEILCMAGVLVKVKMYTDVYAWELSKDWDKKIYIFVWTGSRWIDIDHSKKIGESTVLISQYV